MNNSACFNGLMETYLESIREELVVLYYYLIYSTFSDRYLNHSGQFLYSSNCQQFNKEVSYLWPHASYIKNINTLNPKLSYH